MPCIVCTSPENFEHTYIKDTKIFRGKGFHCGECRYALPKVSRNWPKIKVCELSTVIIVHPNWKRTAGTVQET